MKAIGIDYGEKKTGLAFADGVLAEPLEVIYHENSEVAALKIVTVLKAHEPEVVVVGMPGGEQAKVVQEFVDLLKTKTDIHIETIDERRSTLEAQYLSREAGHSRKKRRKEEDSYSAAIILQKYIDSL